MKIIVINGSPKGEISVTMQYVQFIQKKYSEHELKILNISKNLTKLEKDEQAFKEIIHEIDSADGVLWAFPVYIYSVPSQYISFFELVRKHKKEKAFKGKYTATLSTSVHIFDHTAHQYMNAVCDDFEMKFVDFYPAEVDDLLKTDQRERFSLFFNYFLEAITDKMYTPRMYEPIEKSKFKYTPAKVVQKIDAKDKRIIVLADTEDKHTNLGKMIEQFKSCFKNKIEIYNIHDLDIKGGCKGCLQCWYDNKCIYKDEFINFHQDVMGKSTDVIIFAGDITSRNFSARHKQLTDRIFYNHHKMPVKGSQVSFIVSGPESRMPYFTQIFQGFYEFSNFNYIPGVSDECENSAELDAKLHGLADRVVRYAEKKYIRPSTFLGVSAKKITRDLAAGKLQIILQDDYKHFKKYGYNDFPKKDLLTRFINMLLVLFTKIPAFRREMTKKITKSMIKEHQKVIKQT